MGIGELFLLFLILAAIQPVLRKHFLETMRTRKIAQIERERGTRVIPLIYRQESMNLLGFPLVRLLDMHEPEEVLRAIHLSDDDTSLDIVLHARSRLDLPALQIARAVAAHPGNVSVLVPYRAHAGATLIALAADRIVMCRHSVLVPVKERHRSAAAELLRTHMDEDVALRIAEQLAGETRRDDGPISAEQARSLGLPVTTDMPDAVLQLMSLYPQPLRRWSGGRHRLPRRRAG